MVNYPVQFDALNRVPRIIQQTYLDGTTQYACFAIVGTILTPVAADLEKGRGWAIQKTEMVGTNEEITRWAKNLAYPKTSHGGSNCAATDLPTVQAYNYA